MDMKLTITGTINGKRETNWDNKTQHYLQFLAQDNGAIKVIDVRLAEGDPLGYQNGDKVQVDVRAYSSKNGVGFEALSPCRKETKSA
ncbi:hypothetical protein [Vibrio rotiferianus]|uniref:hypothetical protein n=1 Tax=Vibrio rotiferianus TaxID=190895 RepID=UPI0005763220|nr:hypothetical protein [Vibrio rotiferianus]PIB14499.1 hypothetical protein B853_15922 [Vibrio rotiferianus CAIM 577 = LMG 21460]PIB14782.1 hypothetical protein B853_15650 [Vibrio rotiferianus CAIM 577 = LMG 21460]